MIEVLENNRVFLYSSLNEYKSDFGVTTRWQFKKKLENFRADF
jgi:hypothetical protein